MKLYYFYTLKALWDAQGKLKMYYEMSMVKKQLSGKRSIAATKFNVLQNNGVSVKSNNTK